ncbi:MAG: Gfo/Idh/MocA family oxidoreductase [Phycisphaeraceae bacterium]
MPLDLTILGGGMIVHDQILPSVYHLQRLDRVGAITIAASSTARLRDLVSDRFAQAFLGQSFTALPPLSEPAGKRHPDIWKDAVNAMKPRQMVIVAAPDELHDEMVTFALEHDQHVLCVKPLVHRYEQAKAIEQLARERGLFVGIEYHKRFDRRSLEARGSYRAGRFGHFRCGEAKLIEPWSYRDSNFQNWFTVDKTDPFTYIGCHYVDLVYFITGLRPTGVSVRGVEGTFPNGNRATMWSAGHVTFENGGILSVINGLGYPDDGAGSNDQSMCLFCESTEAREGSGAGAVIHHNDQFRGVSHGFIEPVGDKAFHFINPDYFRLVPFEGDGQRPVGYGYDSIEAHLAAAAQLEEVSASLSQTDALHKRRELLQLIDERGILATPANSFINELVVEAARYSIQNQAANVTIEYEPTPRIRHE